MRRQNSRYFFMSFLKIVNFWRFAFIYFYVLIFINVGCDELDRYEGCVEDVS